MKKRPGPSMRTGKEALSLGRQACRRKGMRSTRRSSWSRPCSRGKGPRLSRLASRRRAHQYVWGGHAIRSCAPLHLVVGFSPSPLKIHAEPEPVRRGQKRPEAHGSGRLLSLNLPRGAMPPPPCRRHGRLPRLGRCGRRSSDIWRSRSRPPSPSSALRGPAWP